MPKKILIVIEDAYSYAGTENVCNFMTTCFTNCKIKLVSLKGNGKPFYPFINVDEIISLNYSKRKWVDYKKIENEFNPDFIFVVSMGKLSVIFCIKNIICNFNSRKKYIACEHISFDSFSYSVKLLKILFLRFYNKVIVLTKRDESKLSSYGINSECISNPVFFRNYKRKDRNRIALAVGRLEFQKGFDILIDIWSEFVAHNKTWKLFIIGEGSMRSMLEAKISTSNLQDYVVLIGLSTEIDKYYKEADVLLSTSRYEGLPMVMLEAKAWSMPIISFDCPTGPRELISDGYDGYLIKLNDKKRYLKCLELIDNDKNYFSLVDNVEETVKELEALNIKNKWQRLLD